MSTAPLTITPDHAMISFYPAWGLIMIGLIGSFIVDEHMSKDRLPASRRQFFTEAPFTAAILVGGLMIAWSALTEGSFNKQVSIANLAPYYGLTKTDLDYYRTDVYETPDHTQYGDCRVDAVTIENTGIIDTSPRHVRLICTNVATKHEQHLTLTRK